MASKRKNTESVIVEAPAEVAPDMVAEAAPLTDATTAPDTTTVTVEATTAPVVADAPAKRGRKPYNGPSVANFVAECGAHADGQNLPAWITYTGPQIVENKIVFPRFESCEFFTLTDDNKTANKIKLVKSDGVKVETVIVESYKA